MGLNFISVNFLYLQHLRKGAEYYDSLTCEYSLNFIDNHNYFQILVPIANGTEEMEAVIIIDILRRAKANVVVASVEDKLEIEASRKVKLEADVLLVEAAKTSYDLIVLPVRGFFTFFVVINQ